MASANTESIEEIQPKLSSRMDTPSSIDEDSTTVYENIDDDDGTLYRQLKVGYGAINIQPADCKRNRRAPESDGPCTFTVCCSIYVLICCFICGLVAIIIGVVFLLGYSADVPPTSLLTNGDYILLLDLNSVTWAYKELIAELSSDDDYDHSTTVHLYKVQCRELKSYVKKKHGCPVRSHSIEANKNTYFKNCSKSPGKCPIDQYVYLLEESNVSYSITVHEYSSTDKIRLLMYDDEIKFKKYLLDYGESEAIYKVNITNETQTVTFDEKKMINHRSYYFFVIALVKGNADHKWFTVNRSCFIASYSGVRSLTPLRNISTKWPISISFIDRGCIVGYYNSSNSNDSVNITWTYGKKRIQMNPTCLFVIGGCCLASVCTVVPIVIAFWVGLIRL